MTQASEQIARQFAAAAINKKQWGFAMYNVLVEGLVGDGVTDDTAKLQALINTAIAAGRKAIFFPHTETGGEYYVTALTNADQVVFFGDNATFVGGYTGTISQIGGSGSNSLVYDVKDFGAVGDGVTDDYQAFMDAITASGSRGIVFVSEPDVTYRISQTIVLSSAIRIEGTHYLVSVSENPAITFDSSVLTGFELLSTDISIEHLHIKLNSTSISVVAGIHLNSPNASGNANTQLRDLFIYLNHTAGAGVKGRNCITSEFHNVRTFQGAYGFYFDTAGTSLKFDSCWSMSCTVTGYYVSSYEYIDFINCACDSPNNPNYAYHIVNSNGVAFNGCGAEGTGKTMFRIEAGNGIAINGCRAVSMNSSGTAIATFAELSSSAAGVVFSGCMDGFNGQPTMPNVIVEAGNGSFPAFINSPSLRSVTINGINYRDSPAMNRGCIKLGLLSINASPFLGEYTVFQYSDIGVAAKRFGVSTSDGGAYLGYIENDGTMVVRTFTALPTADATQRGKLARVEGGTGVADHIYLCRKTATETYEWKQLDV